MSQHLLLEVVNGPLCGQTVVVPANGILLIGRLPECGLSIPQDLTVSRQHCRIEFRPPECRLVHLSQTGATTVNDAPVSTADLRTGDEIAFGAGNTLRVRFEEGGEGIASRTAVPGGIDRPTAKHPNRFTMSPASCGLTIYQSPAEQPGLERMLQILGHSDAIHALIDFRRMGQAPPADLVEPHYLFGWMPPESQAQFSPVMLSSADCPQFAEIVQSGWGHDGIVCFGSALAENELLAHWRTAIGMDGTKPGAAMTASFWPSLLNLMLTCQSHQQVAPLLSGLTWLLIESLESPGQWKLFADEKFTSVLTTAGLLPEETMTATSP